MNADIGPGDWVECLRVARQNGFFQAGSIYQVEEVGYFEPTAQHWLILRSMPRSRHPTGGWCATFFRPIYRPKSEIIQGLLTPVDGLVDA